jgi:hypothetical protein
MTNPRALTGCRSELLACAFLLEKGYDVFRNVSPQGVIDVVAIKDNKISKFDVKTAMLRKISGWSDPRSSKTHEQILQNIEILTVTPDGSCYFEADILLRPKYKPRGGEKQKKTTCKKCGKSSVLREYVRRGFCDSCAARTKLGKQIIENKLLDLKLL